MNRLETLLNAYIRLTEIWSRTSAGDNKSRLWSSCRFLERLIKREVNREDTHES